MFLLALRPTDAAQVIIACRLVCCLSLGFCPLLVHVTLSQFGRRGTNPARIITPRRPSSPLAVDSWHDAITAGTNLLLAVLFAVSAACLAAALQVGQVVAAET